MSETSNPNPVEPPRFPAPTGSPVSGNPPAQSPFSGLTSRDVVAAALTGAAGFAAAYVIAVITLVLTALLAAGSSGATGTTAPDSGLSTGSAPTLDDFVSIWSLIAGAPAQLVLLADLGRLGISGSVDFFTTVGGSAHFGFVPALVAAAQIVALVLGVRLFRRAGLDRRQIVVTSAVSAVALGLVSLIVGLALSIRIPHENGVDVHPISGVTVLAVVIALAVGFVVTLVARPAWLAQAHPLASSVLGTIRVAAAHLGLVAVVTALVVIVYAAITTPSGGAALPAFLGNVAVVVLALGFLGGVSLSESAGSLASTATGSSSGVDTATVFSHTTGWLWLLVLLVVVTALAAGFALAVRRGSASRTTVDWIATVGAYALGGVVILLLGTVVFSVQVSGLGGSGSAGVTPWTVAVLAAWGAAIEVVARYLAPRILPLVSPTALAVTARLIGSDRAGTGAPATSAAGASVGGLAGGGSDGVSLVAAPAPAPLPPRARKILVRSLIGAGIVVVLVVAGSVTVGALRSGPFGPATAARQYLGALASGDAATASRLSGSTGKSTAMMTDAVFSRATGRISDVTIGAVQTSGDIATVAYRYSQAGSRHDGTLKLDRTSTTLLVEDHWRPTAVTGTATITVASALGDAAVTSNGHRVGSAHGGTLTLTAFPGTY